MKEFAETDAKFASALFLAGALLLLVGNGLHPVDADPSVTSRLEIAGDMTWIAIHLAIVIGVILVVAGFAVLQRVIVHPTGSAYARVGSVAAVIGGTLLAIVMGALDGYGWHTLASEWAGASGAGRATVEAAALTLDTIDSGMAAIGTTAFFGIAMLAFGIAMVASRVTWSWLGWSGIVIGITGTATGLLFAVLGPTGLVINGLFRPVAMASTAFFVVLGVALRRQARAIHEVPAASTEAAPAV
jgi:hypothetical protein